MKIISLKSILAGLIMFVVAIGIVFGLIHLFVGIVTATHREMILLGISAFLTMLFTIVVVNKIFSKKEEKLYCVELKTKLEKREKDCLKVHLRRFSKNPKYVCVLSQNQMDWIREKHSGVVFFEGGKGRLIFEYIGSYSYKTSIEETKCNI